MIRVEISPVLFRFLALDNTAGDRGWSEVGTRKHGKHTMTIYELRPEQFESLMSECRSPDLGNYTLDPDESNATRKACKRFVERYEKETA